MSHTQPTSPSSVASPLEFFELQKLVEGGTPSNPNFLSSSNLEPLDSPSATQLSCLTTQSSTLSLIQNRKRPFEYDSDSSQGSPRRNCRRRLVNRRQSSYSQTSIPGTPVSGSSSQLFFDNGELTQCSTPQPIPLGDQPSTRTEDIGGFADPCPPPGNYRISARFFFLTYARCPLSPDQLRLPLLALNGKGFLLYRETHKDGAYHFHVVFDYGRTRNITGSRHFDVEGYHPNVQRVRSLAKCIEYVRKDRDGGPEGGWEEPGDGHSRGGARAAMEEGYDRAIDAPTREAFFGACREASKQDYVIRREQLRKYADELFPETAAGYTPPFVVKPWINIPEICSLWVKKYINEYTHGRGRPRSLCLVGDTRFGKTSWARSLDSQHLYFGSAFNLDTWVEDAKYAIFDDIKLDFFPLYKAWMGGQHQFNITDKYRAKRTITWGKPCIWCVNTVDDPRDAKGADLNWLRGNIIFVHIKDYLFERGEEELPDQWEIDAMANWGDYNNNN